MAPSENNAGFRRQTLFGAVVVVVIAHLLSRILGLGREILLTQHFGAGPQTDAFFAVEVFCFYLPIIFGESLAAILVTLFSEYRAQGKVEEAWQLTYGLAVHLLVGLTGVAIALWWGLPYVFAWVYHFDGGTQGYAKEVLQYMVPLVVCTVLAQLAIGVFHAHRSFQLPAFFFVIVNICILGSIWVLDGYFHWGIQSAALGYTMGVATAMATFWASLWRRGKGVAIRLWHPGIGKAMRLVFPLFLGNCCFVVLALVDQMFAATLGPGALSALTYGDMLFFLVPSFFILALQRVFFPLLSDAVQEKKWAEARNLVQRVVAIEFFLLLPLGVFLFLFSQPLVRLLFERGAYTAEDTYLTSLALSYYSLGMAFLVLADFIQSVFPAFQNTRVPLLLQVVLILLNISLNFLLIEHMGIAGLALASTISELVVFVLFLWVLHRWFLPLHLKELLRGMGMPLLATLIWAAVLYVLDRTYLQHLAWTGFWGNLFYLGILSLIGGALYVAVAYLLCPQYLRDVRELIVKRGTVSS